MKISRGLLSRPKGTPLIVCECTHPKPWPLLVMERVRQYQSAIEHEHNAEFFDIKWHINNMRGFGKYCKQTGVPKYHHLRGCCPQCTNQFTLRLLVPTDVFNLVIIDRAFGRGEASNITLSAKRHIVRFTREEERAYIVKHYMTQEQFKATLDLPDTRASVRASFPDEPLPSLDEQLQMLKDRDTVMLLDGNETDLQPPRVTPITVQPLPFLSEFYHHMDQMTVYVPLGKWQTEQK